MFDNNNDYLVKSIIKGVGKATGMVIVLGVVGCGLWYVSTPKKSMKSKKQVKHSRQTQTDKVLQMEDINEKNSDIDDIISISKDEDYKKIFDKL